MLLGGVVVLPDLQRACGRAAGPRDRLHRLAAGVVAKTHGENGVLQNEAAHGNIAQKTAQRVKRNLLFGAFGDHDDALLLAAFFALAKA